MRWVVGRGRCGPGPTVQAVGRGWGSWSGSRWRLRSGSRLGTSKLRRCGDRQSVICSWRSVLSPWQGRVSICQRPSLVGAATIPMGQATFFVVKAPSATGRGPFPGCRAPFPRCRAPMPPVGGPFLLQPVPLLEPRASLLEPGASFQKCRPTFLEGKACFRVERDAPGHRGPARPRIRASLLNEKAFPTMVSASPPVHRAILLVNRAQFAFERSTVRRIRAHPNPMRCGSAWSSGRSDSSARRSGSSSRRLCSSVRRRVVLSRPRG